MKPNLFLEGTTLKFILEPENNDKEGKQVEYSYQDIYDCVRLIIRLNPEKNIIKNVLSGKEFQAGEKVFFGISTEYIEPCANALADLLNINELNINNLTYECLENQFYFPDNMSDSDKKVKQMRIKDFAPFIRGLATSVKELLRLRELAYEDIKGKVSFGKDRVCNDILYIDYKGYSHLVRVDINEVAGMTKNSVGTMTVDFGDVEALLKASALRMGMLSFYGNVDTQRAFELLSDDFYDIFKNFETIEFVKILSNVWRLVSEENRIKENS